MQERGIHLHGRHAHRTEQPLGPRHPPRRKRAPQNDPGDDGIPYEHPDLWQILLNARQQRKQRERPDQRQKQVPPAPSLQDPPPLVVSIVPVVPVPIVFDITIRTRTRTPTRTSTRTRTPNTFALGHRHGHRHQRHQNRLLVHVIPEHERAQRAVHNRGPKRSCQRPPQQTDQRRHHRNQRHDRRRPRLDLRQHPEPCHLHQTARQRRLRARPVATERPNDPQNLIHCCIQRPRVRRPIRMNQPSLQRKQPSHDLLPRPVIHHRPERHRQHTSRGHTQTRKQSHPPPAPDHVQHPQVVTPKRRRDVQKQMLEAQRERKCHRSQHIVPVGSQRHRNQEEPEEKSVVLKVHMVHDEQSRVEQDEEGGQVTDPSRRPYCREIDRREEKKLAGNDAEPLIEEAGRVQAARRIAGVGANVGSADVDVGVGTGAADIEKGPKRRK